MCPTAKKVKQSEIIFDLLSRSQLAIVANSSKVRLIRMPPSCLDYLSEPVRREIRSMIMNMFLPMPKEDQS